jgi:hypothetical protein
LIVEVCADASFRWIEIGDELALCVDVEDDGVLRRNVALGGEIVEGNAEVVAEWVEERARLTGD